MITGLMVPPLSQKVANFYKFRSRFVTKNWHFLILSQFYELTFLTKCWLFQIRNPHFTKRNFNQIWLGSYSKPERECLISKLTSKRNSTLIFGVAFARGKMKPLTICLHVTLVYSVPQSKLEKIGKSSVDTPDIGRKYFELLILSCHLMMMLE